MTQTVDRRPLTRPAPPARRGSPRVVVPGLTAAAWAAGAGLVTLAVPVLLAWATDSRSGAGAAEATRTAGQLWLLAHGAWLTVPGGAVGLVPLGLLALPLLLLHRAGRHAARSLPVTSARDAVQLVLAVAAPYALAAAVLAPVCASRAVSPAPVRALLGALLVALVGAGSGVLREAGGLRAGAVLPDRVRRMALASAAALAGLLAGGAALAGLALALHAGRATALARATSPGLVGGVALLLLGLLLAPNAAVWGMSWASGPGFAVGVGTTVSPLGTDLGPVPAFPMLAALPGSDVPVWVGVLALLVPLAAGVGAGVLLLRRLPRCSWQAGALEAAAVGPVVGLAAAALCALSGGPLGGGRLAAVGPSPWQVGIAVALEVAVPAAVTAVVVVRRR
jgi:hypothetical protein